jgi:hypothetical protein
MSSHSCNEVGAMVATPRRRRWSRISQSHMDTVPNSDVITRIGWSIRRNASTMRYAAPFKSGTTTALVSAGTGASMGAGSIQSTSSPVSCRR